METMKQGENINISDFILDIGKKIEQVSGVNLNFSKEATVPEEKWILGEQKKMLLKGVQLRTEKQTQNLEVVELKKFDPCSLSGKSKISCRAFGCQQTTSRLSEDPETKQDLFLCKAHRQNLKDLITKCFAKQNVSIDLEKSNNFEAEGYASLIGALEKAFMHLKSKRLTTTTDALLAEVFLNTRNFLIITSALLNPDDDNITAALGPYLTTFHIILKDQTMLGNAIILLIVAMRLIYHFYGIIYQWVHLPLENPGAKIGFGVGLLFVSIVTSVSDSVPFWFKGLFCGVCIPYATSLIGNGIWARNTDTPFINKSREKMTEIHREILSIILRQPFVISADVNGNISVTATELNDSTE